MGWVREVRGWMFAVLLAGVAGCATVGGQTPQEAVQERAQQRWDALVKGDFEAAYAYLSPGSRQVMKKDDFVASLRRDFWKGARVEKVTCATPESCVAEVAIEYEFQGRRTQSPLRENWIREGSMWWYVLKA